MRFLPKAMILLAIFSCQNKEPGSVRKTSPLSQAEIPYIKGESKKIFDAKPSPDFDEHSWFTNDHCFVTDHEGKLHWFGINNPYPPEGKQLYRYHPYLGHLISENATHDWERLPFALDESEGSEYLGAPFIIWHEESGKWVMVLETMLGDTRRLEVCWSDDLFTWQRTYQPILPDKLWISSRDPHIMKGPDGKYWIHIVSTGNKGILQSQVLRIGQQISKPLKILRPFLASMTITLPPLSNLQAYWKEMVLVFAIYLRASEVHGNTRSGV